MTNQEIQAIRERVEKAIDGPWKRGTDGEKFIILANEEAKVKGWKYRVIVESLPTDGEDEELEDQEHYNTDFITHAREDVPKLLDEVEHLEHLRGKKNEAISEMEKEIEQLRQKRGQMEKTHRQHMQAKAERYEKALQWIADASVDYQSINKAKRALGEEFK